MDEQHTISARTANVIKKELRKLFPNTKFSVRSSNFSMGNSVDIRWIDGPTTDEVDKVVGKYQSGHFDGMTDMYEYSNSRDDIPQAKYVMTSREMSEETKQKIIDKHNETFCEEGQIKDLNAWNDDAHCWNSDLIWREFRVMSL